MQMTNNTILITGGTSGIGLAFAKAFSAKGNKVIICGRRKNVLEDIHTVHPEIAVVTCDVNEETDRKALFAWVAKHYPQTNILINNAGFTRLYDLNDAIDTADITEEVNTNLIAPIHLSSLFAKHLSQQDNAAIINISSGLGFTPSAKMPVYSATKAAIHSYSLSLRHQLKDAGVSVFEIIPPALHTEFSQRGNYDNTSSRPITLEEFLPAAMAALETDKYEAPIGMAEKMHAEREKLFAIINP